MDYNNFTIWILDSWKGWYYALLDIKSHFPQYNYKTYLDYINAPYGNKTSEEIYTLTEVGCQKLWNQWCQIILIACNTICAETLRKLQDTYIDKKILWCIIPSAEVAVKISHGKIGLIWTYFTVNSWKYQREITKLSWSHKVFSLATPELAWYIEDGLSHDTKILNYVDIHIKKLLKKEIDTLILACTHYTVYYEYISMTYPQLKIVDSARTQTIKLWEYLSRHRELFK